MQFLKYHGNNVTTHVIYKGQTVQVSLSDIAEGYFPEPELAVCARRIREMRAARGFAAFLRFYSPEESEPVLYANMEDALFDFYFIIKSANYFVIPIPEQKETGDIAFRAKTLDQVIRLFSIHMHKRGFSKGYRVEIYHRGGLTVIPPSSVALESYLNGRISALKFMRLMLRKGEE